MTKKLHIQFQYKGENYETYTTNTESEKSHIQRAENEILKSTVSQHLRSSYGLVGNEDDILIVDWDIE